MRIEAHLSFNGNCAEAFAFYKSILGGELFLFKYEDAPADDGAHDPAMKDRIMHATLNVGETSFMGADAPPQWTCAPQGFCTSIGVDTVEEATRIWEGLSDGAKAVHMPLAPTFWSPMFGMLIDKYDQPWMINTAAPEGYMPG